MSKRVVIIGGGIGGLATANLLAKAGYRVTVLEKNNYLGGRAGLLKADGYTFDTGPSWYLMPEVFRHYFSLLDADVDTELDLVRLDPAYRVFFESGDHIDITSDLARDKKTFNTIEPGSGEALERYVKDGIRIYNLSIKHFLYTNFQSISDVLKRDVLGAGPRMLRLAFQPIHSRVTRYIQNAQLQKILEYHMVFLGSSPFRAPAIYSLMSALDFDEGVYYPRGGMYTIIEAILRIGRKLGVSYETNAPVAEILTESGRATGVRLEDDTKIDADIVISNADIHHTETRLLPPCARSYDDTHWNKQNTGLSALLMYLGVEGKIPELTHHNLIFVDDWKGNFDAIYESKTIPNPASIYLCKPGEVDPTVTTQTGENVFVLVPLPSGVNIDDESLEALADTYLEQIADMAKVPDLPERVRYRKLYGPSYFHEMFNSFNSSALGASHDLNQSAIFRTSNKSKKLDNLYYVGGNTIPGIGLPMCLIGSELIYKHLAGDKRGGAVESIELLT